LHARQSSIWRSCPVIELIGTATTDIFVFFVRSGKFVRVGAAGKVGSEWIVREMAAIRM